jgi:uncharacterized protein YajQ (UPF0234 family)
LAQDSSFDIVSEVDLQEVDNAVNQAVKEMQMRYDFRGTKSSFTFEKPEKKIILFADDEMKLKAMQDMLATKAAKRNISPKAFKYKDAESAIGGAFRQEVELVVEIPQETSKEIVKWIKETKVKVQASIQGEKVRVSGKKKDDLQFIQQMLRNKPIEIPIQFTNYRG